MAALVLPQRRKAQPQYPIGVDWGNPLSTGLLVLANGGIGFGGGITGYSLTNLVSGIPFTYSTQNSQALINSVLNEGSAISFIGSHALTSETLKNIGTGDFTDFWYGYPVETPLGTSRPCFLIGSDNNLTGIAQFGGSNNGAGSTSVDTVITWATTWITSGFVAPLNSKLFVVSTRLAGIQYLYINGVLYGSTTNSTNIGAQKLVLGSFLPANTFWADSNKTLCAGRFGRGLAASEALSLSVNPWQLFSPRLT